MHEEDDKILKYKYGKKYMRFSFIIYTLLCFIIYIYPFIIY